MSIFAIAIPSAETVTITHESSKIQEKLKSWRLQPHVVTGYFVNFNDFV